MADYTTPRIKARVKRLVTKKSSQRRVSKRVGISKSVFITKTFKKRKLCRDAAQMLLTVKQSTETSCM